MRCTIVTSILIRVTNLETCRAFYRDILGLGAPMLDSNFWVEFQLGNTSLCLEKADWSEKLPPKSARVSWMLTVESLENFSTMMQKYGYAEGTDSSDRLGFPVKIFADPEGNPFYVTERKNNPE